MQVLFTCLNTTYVSGVKSTNCLLPGILRDQIAYFRQFLPSENKVKSELSLSFYGWLFHPRDPFC